MIGPGPSANSSGLPGSPSLRTAFLYELELPGAVTHPLAEVFNSFSMDRWWLIPRTLAGPAAGVRCCDKTVPCNFEK